MRYYKHSGTCEWAGLPWSKILPLALMTNRFIPHGIHIHPSDIVTVGHTDALIIQYHLSPTLINSDAIQYCQALMHYAKVYFLQVEKSLHDSPTGDNQTIQDLEPGSWVFFGNHTRERLLSTFTGRD